MGLFGRKEYDENGFDKRGIHSNGTRFDDSGFDKDGYDKDGFTKDGIHELTGTKFAKDGFTKDGIHELTGTKFAKDGYDRDGFDKNGIHKQFELTSIFSEITSSFNSDFDALIALAYNDPTKIKSKLFFSHDAKTGIYSKSFESFSNNNMLHFHIEKAGKQYGTIWNKPKDTGKLQGDNFESGYTLIVNFNKNDSELKSILIKKLGRMNFGSLPSEYTLDCHLNEEYPNDERAKELLQIIVGLFSTAATVDFSSNDPTRT